MKERILKEDHRKKVFRRLGILLFVVYLAMLSYFLFFSERLGRIYLERTYHYNLELFKEIRRFWVYRHSLGMWSVGLNLIGNVVAFLPFGAFLPILFEKCKKFYLTTLLCFEFSLCVEVIQLVWKVGSFDVDDILLNTLGGMLGYLCYHIYTAAVKKHNRQDGQSGGKDEKKKPL